MRLRHAYVIGLLLFVSGVLGITAYTIWLLRTDATARGYEFASMHSRSFEDVLTQQIHLTEILSANILQHVNGTHQVGRMEPALVDALRRTPFLRSISLLDSRKRVIVSSNPANVGLSPKLDNFLPQAGLNPEMLRIGPPWAGRDFEDGHPAEGGQVVGSDEAYFIPVIQTLQVGGTSYTLLASVNPDHFINHLLQKLEAREGWVEVLRYDGILLMSTDPRHQPGSRRDHVIPVARLKDTESAGFRMDNGSDRRALSAFRASRLYPVVVVTNLDQDYALRNWRTTSKTLLGFIVPTLFLVCAVAVLLYRRQAQLGLQRAKFEQVQRINATVFYSSQEAILITGLDNRIISINPSFTRVTGYLSHEVLGLDLLELLTAESAAVCGERLPQPEVDGDPRAAHDLVRIEVQQRCKDGRLLWMEILSTPERDGRGKIVGYHRIGRNISQRKRAEEQLQLSANVFTFTREGILITSPDGTIIEVNSAFCNITGFSRDELLGRTLRILRPDLHGETLYDAMWSELTEKGHWHGEVWYWRKGGEPLAVILTISAVCDETGKARQHVALMTDITPLKVHQSELEHIANFDALTDLPNRMLLADRLHQAMTQSLRRDLKLAVAFLDLDGFKVINDTYGHDSGDQLLVAVAQRMKLILRDGDTLARMGGDEFVVVMIDVSDMDDSLSIFSRLLEAAARPVQIGEHQVQVSASLGITFYPQVKSIEADQLLRQADQAMYQAKIAGKNRYHIFVPEGE